MSVRGYDSFLVTTSLGGNRKVRRLTPAERWCAVHGVWAIAAESPERGSLWIAEGVSATEKDYAEMAGVSIGVAKSTVRKMRELGMLEAAGGVEYVHDWDQHQREPKPSDSPASRRERKRKSRGSHANVTRDMGQSHAPEVEVEEEGKDEANASSSGAPEEMLDRPEVSELCHLLADSIASEGVKRPDPEQKGWLEECRRLLDIDGATTGEVRHVIAWVHKPGSFWAPNILSMRKLREKWPQLVMQIRREHGRGEGETTGRVAALQAMKGG